MVDFRRGVQAEILLSLALVMIIGSALLAAIFVQVNHTRIEALHGVLGKGFFAETQADGFDLHPIDGGLWWRIHADGRVTGLNGAAVVLDTDPSRCPPARITRWKCSSRRPPPAPFSPLRAERSSASLER